ncbi:hypothetical protein [Halomonas kalidii]|uniref:Uncharacterized protein n=1 Tax=Halomonas kalidii TaxID=3043293 RepID=A0ABT6VDY4_9GAMM|nr:hypothetical protein [Halomonas kalidii]MDI5932204.1 hypothetical protein [Halomonas kalidii]
MSARALQPLMPFAFGLLVVAPDLLAGVLVLLTILWLVSRKYDSQVILTNQGDTPCRDDHSGHEGEIVAMGDAPYAHDDHNRRASTSRLGQQQAVRKPSGVLT